MATESERVLRAIEARFARECPRKISLEAHRKEYLHLEWRHQIYCVRWADGLIELQELGMELSLGNRLWRDYLTEQLEKKR